MGAMAVGLSTTRGVAVGCILVLALSACTRLSVDPAPGGFDAPLRGPPADASGASASGGSPKPDFDEVLPGDDAADPLPLGVINAEPTSVRLDFLFEFCQPTCFRDAHFMDPDDPTMGSGGFTAGEPFHVRHGFINEEPEPLGEGFNVVLYVTELEIPGGENVGKTFRYTADYVIRGEADHCGPTYRTHDMPVTCEWFVHQFPNGLPAGRHAMWAVWEAPCRAWLDYGFTASCDDPETVMSLFFSGFDGPFGPDRPQYDEAEGGVRR